MMVYQNLNAKQLKFEGEYLNDIIWNGKGFDLNGNMKYELNNGKGKIIEYNEDGILEFEGEYLNGKRNGKGKEYYRNKQLKFEGEYLNGDRNGKGKEYYKNGKLKFEGKYLNGKKWNGNRYKINGFIQFEIKKIF